MKKAVVIILILLLLLLFGACAVSICLGYNSILDYLIAARGEQQNHELFHQLITPAKFHRIQLMLMLYTIGIGFLLYKVNDIYNISRGIISDLYSSFKNIVSRSLKSELKYLLIIPMLSAIYYAVVLPVTCDEAWTYFVFTHKGFAPSFLYYPATNDHVLHSIITNCTKYIPLLNPLMRLRVSSIIAYFFMLIIAYSFLEKYLNKTAALVIISIAALLHMSIYYSYLSRGYALVSLFFVTASYSIYNIIKYGHRRKDWICFTVCCILGIYAIPSTIYAVIILNFILVIFSYKYLLRCAIACVAVLTGVLLLYSPIIAVNGINSLIYNPVVAPIPRDIVIHKLPFFLQNAIFDITSFNSSYVFYLLGISFVLLLLKRMKAEIVVFTILVICPCLILLAHSVIPPNRTFNYYSYILVFLIVLPWSDYLGRLRPVYVLPLLIAVQAVLVYNFDLGIYEKEDGAIVSEKCALAIEGDKKYLINDPFSDYSLLFNLESKGYHSYEITRKLDQPLSADTISGYDYAIIRNENDRTVTRIPKIKTPYYTVYSY